MKSLRPCLLALLVSGFACAPALGQATTQHQRIQAAYALTFGEVPTPKLLSDIEQLGSLSATELFTRMRHGIGAERMREVAAKATADAFGIQSAAPEAAPAGEHLDYAQLLSHHLQWLAAHPAEYDQVVQRAYRRVLDRDPYPDEVEYWRVRPVTSYVMLVACVDNWALRNAPGLMETTGTPAISVNSRYLSTVTLSPTVAAEVSAAAELAAENPALAVAADRTIVAPGAGAVLSVRGIPFVAVGRRTAMMAGE